MRSLRYEDTQILVYVAHFTGWHIVQQKALKLVAVDGTTLEVPTNSGLNFKVFRSRLRTILRHRDPALSVPLGPMINMCIEHVGVKVARANQLRSVVSEFAEVHKPVKTPAAPFAPTTAEKYPLDREHQDALSMSKEEVVAAFDAGEPAEVITQRKPEVIREEPWSAHTHVGKDGLSRTYPSEAVLEREWSDGTIEHVCQAPDCDYAGVPRSVASHFASKHRRGQGRADQPPIDGIDPDWTPQKRAQITKLRREIDGALVAALSQGIDWDEVDQAEWIAEWIVAHRVDTAVSGSDETEPADLTPEQILDRIGALVDRGRGKMLREQIESLNSAVDGFMAALDDARNEAARSAARAEKAENDLRAVHDMLTEYAPREVSQ